MLDRPENAHALLVLGHSAGAGMHHPFMQRLTEALCERGVAVYRYEFSYMREGRGRVDPAPVLELAVREAVGEAHAEAPDLPLFAGGKSLGGRMTSRAAASPGLDARGLIFFGFPLHPAKQPATDRAHHLAQVPQPMLFLQGTRDELADIELIRAVTTPLPRATLHVVEGADHGFEVLKRSGRADEDVLRELADTAVKWMRGVNGAG